MRILFLSTSMGMGGADKQLLTAAQDLRTRGHEVLVVSLTALGPMGVEARASGVPTESLEMRRGVPDPRGLLRLARLVRAWRPDLVHSHMVHANLMARALRVLVPIPALISTIHNIYEGGPLLMAGYRLTNRLVDQMTIVSQAAADRFVAEGIVPKELLRVLPNGVDTGRFRDLSPATRQTIRGSFGVGDEFVWIAVGRFEIAKDYPNMLRAFAKARTQRPHTILVLVGHGSLQRETEALANGLGLHDSVRFLGVRHDVPEVMSAADGYLMSSAWEGMPIVLLEAAAAGLPIVATAVGGNSEVVHDRESGLLVPARDSEALSMAMVRLMDTSAAERRIMGERGREHVEARYGLRRSVQGWEELYREVLRRKGLSAGEAGVVPAPDRSGEGRPDDRPASAGA